MAFKRSRAALTWASLAVNPEQTAGGSLLERLADSAGARVVVRVGCVRVWEDDALLSA